MITITTITQAVIDRIRACLPQKMKNNVIRFPDIPGEFSPDVLRTKYPGGALLVKYLESHGENGAEVAVIGVCVVAETSLREEKLAEAVRGYLNKYQVPGITRFEFATDKQLEVELGIVCRTIAYGCHRPAIPAPNIEALNAALNL